MKNNETCIHGGVSPISLLTELHISQAGSGRHRCPTCAYEQGFNIGISGNWKNYQDFCTSLIDSEICTNGSIAPTHILLSLGENQGGTGRHKCTNCAFKEGFEAGIQEGVTQEINIELVLAPNTQKTLKNVTKNPKKIDFAEREIKNKQLGLLGEIFIFKNEVEFLTSEGREDLAKKVQHVSVQIGDGLGYDILSYDLFGNEKKIEVKTTRSDISRPFFLTKNELEISSKSPESYYLYRLFDFDSKLNKGKYYVITGDLNSSLELEALLYMAYPKTNNEPKKE